MSISSMTYRGIAVLLCAYWWLGMAQAGCPVTQLPNSGKGYHTCAILQTGQLKCWGANIDPDTSLTPIGQLGTGRTDIILGSRPSETGDNLLPVQLGAGRTVLQVSLAVKHTCVLLDNQKVKCFGANFLGQLGYNDNVTRGLTPDSMGDNLPYVNVGSTRTITRVQAGQDFTCVILGDGGLKCWGWGEWGQLGTGSSQTAVGRQLGDMEQLTHVDLGPGMTALDVCCGNDFTCVLRSDQQVVCFGNSSMGQLGVDRTDPIGFNRTDMGANLRVVDMGVAGRTVSNITCGMMHACVILTDGHVRCWGESDEGQLGQGNTQPWGTGKPGKLGSMPDVDLGSGRKAIAISAGWKHTCVLRDDHSVVCFGGNLDGQLGLGAVEAWGKISGQMGNNLRPVDLGKNRTAMAVMCGVLHTCVLFTDGDMKCFGNNEVAELGLGNLHSRGDGKGPGSAMGDALPVVPLCGGSSGSVAAPATSNSILTTNITFNLHMVMAANMSSMPSGQIMFESELRASVAAFFGVLPTQVQVQLNSDLQQSSSRRMLLQSQQPNTGKKHFGITNMVQHVMSYMGTNVVRGTSGVLKRKLLAAAAPAMDVAVVVTASWPATDADTPARLAAQVTQLQHNPPVVLASGMIQQFQIDTKQVQLVPNQVASTRPLTAFTDTSPQSVAPSSGGDHKTPSTVIIAAAASAGGVLLISAAVLTVYCMKRSRGPRYSKAHSYSNWYGPTFNSSQLVRPTDGSLLDDSPFLKAEVLPEGLITGDPFMQTAKQYAWEAYNPNEYTTRVEAGVNDVQLLGDAELAAADAVQLTRADVQQQLLLLPNGLIGRGGAALVFMGRWPSRFGPHALLAVKVLKNPYECSAQVLQSFAYEAKLLASLRHPHVVRLYAYCLELPTVCLIMELLPGSLEDLLYQKGAMSGVTNNSLMVTHAGSSGLQTLLSRVPLPATITNTTSHVSGTVEAVSDVGVMICDDVVAPIASASSELHAAEQQLRASKTQPSSAQSRVMATTGEATESKGPGVVFTVRQVLQISADVAAALAYLHTRRIVTSDLTSSVHDAEAALKLSLHAEESAAPKQVSSSIQQHTDDDFMDEMEDLPSNVMRIVHRDLKPGNVLLSSQGHAKLSDFGLARENTSTTLHTMHAGAGTLVYMAPELLAARNGMAVIKPTNRVDIYSLAILMWELVARKQPWRGYNAAQLVAAVCSQQRPEMPDMKTLMQQHNSNKARSSSSGAADMDTTPASFEAMPEFAALIRSCWRHRDLRRPEASEVHAKLHAMLQGMTTPSPSTTAEPIPPPSQHIL